MARHLLLKNNTVSLSQRVKRNQIQNRENMRDNYFQLFPHLRWTTDGILEKLWLLNFNGVLTNFLQILHYFLNCLYRFLGIASVRRRKKKKTWGLYVRMRPGNESIQQSKLVSGYSLCTCSFRFRFGVHFESVKSIVSITPTCLISFKSLSP